jgi:hypothetical protein
MIIIYDGQNPNASAHFRFAIYQYRDGEVGDLIAQTPLGTAYTPVDKQWDNDHWLTLRFDSPVHLQSGTYWLMFAGDYLANVHDDVVDEPYKIAICALDSLDCPATLPTTGANRVGYSDINMVIAIYASGQGPSSLAPAPSPDANHPAISALALSCQKTDNATSTTEIIGQLTAYNIGVPQATVGLGYRAVGDLNWTDITQTVTAQDGSFQVQWTPPSPGTYQINATYWGADIYTPAFTAIEVLVTVPSGSRPQQVFSLESNSTISNLSFNSESDELTFSVSGESGTSGYTDACIAKSLVADPNSIHAYIDDKQFTCTVSESGDCWILHFTYHHSSHDIRFDLGGDGGNSSSVQELPEGKLLIAAAVLAVVAVAAVALVLAQRKRRRV